MITQLEISKLQLWVNFSTEQLAINATQIETLSRPSGLSRDFMIKRLLRQ